MEVSVESVIFSLSNINFNGPGQQQTEGAEKIRNDSHTMRVF